VRSWGDEEEKTWNNEIAPAKRKKNFGQLKFLGEKFSNNSHFNFLL